MLIILKRRLNYVTYYPILAMQAKNEILLSVEITIFTQLREVMGPLL